MSNLKKHVMSLKFESRGWCKSYEAKHGIIISKYNFLEIQYM